jgi:hypothetical protein
MFYFELDEFWKLCAKTLRPKNGAQKWINEIKIKRK